jgi:hypothetical protein
LDWQNNVTSYIRYMQSRGIDTQETVANF